MLLFYFSGLDPLPSASTDNEGRVFLFLKYFKGVLSRMSPSDISSYLTNNIITIGTSSLTPTIYLSMDTLKCITNAEENQSIHAQCSGMIDPQQSICSFFLIILIIKVIIAPLSTTAIDINDLARLNVPRRHIVEGVLFFLSFLINLYMYANMEEGPGSEAMGNAQLIAMRLVFVALAIELTHMIRKSAHKTSLQSPRGTNESGISLASQPSIPLSPDPSDTGVSAGFI